MAKTVQDTLMLAAMLAATDERGEPWLQKLGSLVVAARCTHAIPFDAWGPEEQEAFTLALGRAAISSLDRVS